MVAKIGRNPVAHSTLSLVDATFYRMRNNPMFASGGHVRQIVAFISKHASISGSSRDAIRQSGASDTTTGNIASISSRIKSNLNPINASLPHRDIDSKCTIGLMDSSYPVYDIETELKDFLVPNEPHFVISEPTSKPYIQGVPALKSLALTQLFSSDQNDGKKLGSVMEEIDNTTTLWNQEIPRSSVEKKNESQLINIPINSISTLPLEIHNDITRPLTVDTNVCILRLISINFYLETLFPILAVLGLKNSRMLLLINSTVVAVLARKDLLSVFLIQYARGLELRMPDDDDNFTLKSVVDIFGGSHKVDTIDVYRQMTHSMSLGAFYEKMTKRDRPRLYNILSLEFSQNEKMRQYVAPPILVPEISFVHRLWPDRNDPVNWDSDMDYLPSSMKGELSKKVFVYIYIYMYLVGMRQIVEVLEEHRLNKPEVALFCLAGMGGSYTDFHIDFGGSSVWYHIYKGQKVFYIVEPTEENLALFEQYQKSETKTETFLGDLLPDGALRRVVIEQGQTLMIPSGWIHAVYTPVDSLVFGGNFLHALNIPMQLRVYDMELRLKAEVGTEEKFLFPHFELVNWYAARSFILEHIREANDEGNSADDYMMESARALLPRLKEWMKRDKITSKIC
uniref:JmjC domain-containing protein n=1 Tax=Heterorhabditis bacteriophora TaxID=37862 RepID=A0A1I7XCW5_HETBA